MIFNSIEFLVFALLFFLLWPLFRKRNNSRWFFLTVTSFIFYAWWDWRFLFLIIFSGLIDYVAGILLIRIPKRKVVVLSFSLIANLGSLSIFKYSKFFATVIQDTALLFDVQINLIDKIPEFALILPVGISFYTFQSLSYTIDIYRGRLKPTYNILHFFSYLSMFPQLVAGPIVRAKDFLMQLRTYKIPNSLEKWNALKMICFGLFQKVVIADNLSFLIDSAYEGKTIYDGTAFWWLVSISFSFQIYCDFSGYSLIARGLAKYMGYHFRMNFNHPYLSKSFKEFWTRWHISLSTWFRDYVYIPLGGSRKTVIASIATLTATMLLSGIWHGPKYTFLVWAGIHVLFLLFERFTKWSKKLKVPTVLLILITFLQATLAWVYFRAVDIGQANEIMTKLFCFEPTNLKFMNYYMNTIIFLFLGIIIEFSIYLRKTNLRVKSLLYKNKNLDIVILILCILSILFLRGEGKQFIYFQF